MSNLTFDAIRFNTARKTGFVHFFAKRASVNHISRYGKRFLLYFAPSRGDGNDVSRRENDMLFISTRLVIEDGKTLFVLSVENRENGIFF